MSLLLIAARSRPSSPRSPTRSWCSTRAQIVERGPAREVLARRGTRTRARCSQHPAARGAGAPRRGQKAGACRPSRARSPICATPLPGCRFQARCPEVMDRCRDRSARARRDRIAQGRVACAAFSWPERGGADDAPRGATDPARLDRRARAERAPRRTSRRRGAQARPARPGGEALEALPGRRRASSATALRPRRRRRDALRAPRRDARPRRRVGLRQEHARPHDAPPHRADARPHRLRRQRPHAMQRRASSGRCGGACRSSFRTRIRRSTRG